MTTDKLQAFNEWIDIATEYLSDEAKTYIRKEKEQNYLSAYETAITNGKLDEKAQIEACQSLGNPYHTKQRYQHEYLNKLDMDTIRIYTKNKYVSALFLFMMLLLFSLTIGKYSSFVSGNPITAWTVWTVSIALLGIYSYYKFIYYPNIPFNKNNYSSIIISNIYIENGTLLWFCSIAMLSGIRELSYYSLTNDINTLLTNPASTFTTFFVMFIGIVVPSLVPKLQALYKLRKRSDYLPA